jgi:type VI secretion system secreted protein Hcp
MASDIFMKIGSYKGESQDGKHKEEIDVLAWSWGVSQAGTMNQGGGGGAGKATYHDLTFSHNFDVASPNLIKACASGEHIKEAQLTVRKAGKVAEEYLIIKMQEVFITSVSQSDSGGDSNKPMETVQLQFASFKMDYKPQKPDGSLGAAVPFNWNISKNEAA